jgi:hypothetical protein
MTEVSFSHFTNEEAKALGTHARKGQDRDAHPSLPNPADAAFLTGAKT